MDPSQDISQEPPQENTPSQLPVAIEPHACSLPISLPLPSPPLSSVAYHSNVDPSSSLAPPQSNAVTHFTPKILYYAPCPADRSILPGWSPETGLPREVWLIIFRILFDRRNAFTLLACTLTCRFFREPSQDMINHLTGRTIRSWMYKDIDQLVGDIREAPRDAKRITRIWFQPDNLAQSAVALSVVPLRLAGQRVLTNMNTLYLGILTSRLAAHLHPRSCPLFGRTFPNVTEIDIKDFQFHSFMEFAFLVTSFPALTSLCLWGVSCTNEVIPPSVARGPKKRNLQLTKLHMRQWQSDRSWFSEIFLWWLLRRCSRFPKEITFYESLFDHSWGREVLRNCHGELEEFNISITLDSEVRRSQDDVTRKSWLDAFKPGSPIAQTVELENFKESDIPMMKTFIAHHMGPTQKLKLKDIWPTAKYFYSFSWKTLDTLLFSWYMLRGSRNSQALFLDLRVPPKLWDTQQAPNDEKNPWLRFLFPLNMAVGEGMWLGDCTEERHWQ